MGMHCELSDTNGIPNRNITVNTIISAFKEIIYLI